MKAIKNEFENGTTYIGASAGALIAGKDIKLAADFDKNDVRLKEEIKNIEGFMKIPINYWKMHVKQVW